MLYQTLPAYLPAGRVTGPSGFAPGGKWAELCPMPEPLPAYPGGPSPMIPNGDEVLTPLEKLLVRIFGGGGEGNPSDADWDNLEKVRHDMNYKDVKTEEVISWLPEEDDSAYKQAQKAASDWDMKVNNSQKMHENVDDAELMVQASTDAVFLTPDIIDAGKWGVKGLRYLAAPGMIDNAAGGFDDAARVAGRLSDDTAKGFDNVVGGVARGADDAAAAAAAREALENGVSDRTWRYMSGKHVGHKPGWKKKGQWKNFQRGRPTNREYVEELVNDTLSDTKNTTSRPNIENGHDDVGGYVYEKSYDINVGYDTNGKRQTVSESLLMRMVKCIMHFQCRGIPNE